MVLQCLIKAAAAVGIQDISPEWMARQFQIAAIETPALAATNRARGGECLEQNLFHKIKSRIESLFRAIKKAEFLRPIESQV